MLPTVTTMNAPFWEGCEQGELRLQTCASCSTRRFPEAPVCPRCLASEYSWEPASGRGVLWSWITIHQSYFPAYADELPYRVAFIRLEEGPYMISKILDEDADLRCDQPVRVTFFDLGGRVVPAFEVAE